MRLMPLRAQPTRYMRTKLNTKNVGMVFIQGWSITVFSKPRAPISRMAGRTATCSKKTRLL